MSILDLPEEMYDVIFAHLSLGDVFNCMQVCKKFYWILEKGNSKLWKYHSLKTVPYRPLKAKTLRSLSSHKSRLMAFKYAWNPMDCCPDTRLLDDFTFILLKDRPSHGSNRNCARGKLGFEAGRHSWEITCEFGLEDITVIGVATKDDSNTDPNLSLGIRCESWGWELNHNWLIQNGFRMRKHHSGVLVHYPQSPKCGPNLQVLPKYQIGDRISVILDMEENTLAFEMNNTFLGVAFRGLPKKRLFPAVMGMLKQGVQCLNQVSMVYLGSHFNVPSRPAASIRPNPASSRIPPNGAVKSSPVSDHRVDELTTQLVEMKLTVEGMEKERDFYFNKLRDIEVICQEPEYAENTLTTKILDILYATEDGFAAPEEQDVPPPDEY